MPRYQSTRRILGSLLIATAVAAALIWAAWKIRPVWANRQQAALVDELALQIADSPDRRAAALVRQLAKLTPSAIGRLVELAAGQRAATTQAAQAEIDALAAHWEVLADEDLFGPGEADEMVQLATALAEEASAFGSLGQQWAGRLLLRLVDQADRIVSRRAAELLAACDRALSQIPSPTRLPLVAPTPAPPLQPRVAETHIDVPSLRGADIGVEVNNAGEQPRLPARRAPSLGVGLDTQRADSQALRWGTGGPRSTVLPLPRSEASLPSASQEPPSIESAGGRTARAIDIPSPQLMRGWIRQLRTAATDTLQQQLAAANRYEAAAIRTVLADRGIVVERTDSPVTQARASAATAAESDAGAEGRRPQVVEQALRLQGAAARLRLRELVEHAQPLVRLHALRALATAEDPKLLELAERRALLDDDNRVAELAAQLLRRRSR